VNETTWNQSPGPATTQTPAPNAVSGGGICSGPVPLAIPTYQVPFVNGTNGASATWRNLPDVSMVGADLTLVYNNGTIHYCAGGTSAAAPLWAAFTALVNQGCAAGGRSPVGYLNPYLYDLASNTASYASDFNDVRDGSNNNYWGMNPNEYRAVAGYDLATGLGSPQCNLISDIVGQVPTVTYTPTPASADTVRQAYPNPISGNGPLYFQVQVVNPSRVTWKIFTTSFRMIYSNQQTVANLETLSWNLLDKNGGAVANGLYYIQVNVADGPTTTQQILKVIVLK